MKTHLLITSLLFSFFGISQSQVQISSLSQYAYAKGGLQVDSAFSMTMSDTISPFVKYPSVRKVGRMYCRPQDFRIYIHDGLKYRPINTFTAALEAKLNAIAPGATANQTDAFLKDRSNHTGTQPYSTITGLSPVSWTGNYIDLMGRPDLSAFMQYGDTISLSNRINKKANIADTIGGSGTGVIMTTASANQSLNTKVSKATTLSINGTSFDLSANRSWTNIGIELPSQTGQSGKVLSTNGTAVSWTTPVNNTYTAGTGISIVSNVVTNTAPNQVVTLTAGRGISVTGSYPNFTISLVTPTIDIRTGGTARALNTNFTVSSTKEAFVSYSLTCTVTNPLVAGSSTANVFLEYSTNGGTTWQLPSQNGNSSSVGVAVAIAITNSQTVTVSGYIPANALTRLRTTTTGTATISYITGQETTY